MIRRARPRRRAPLVLAALAALGISPARAQSPHELAEAVAREFLSHKLPAALELYYLDTKDSDRQSLAIRYDWNSNQEWKDDFGDAGTDFSGSSHNVFVRGNYVDEEDANPSELSEIGASWSRRWFPISVANPLSEEEGRIVQRCVLNGGFGTTVEDCRVQSGFEPTRMSYWYVDVDAHAKIEGDQRFDQRHYTYGVEANFSKSLGGQRWILNPVLTLGFEQVDPKGDLAREAAGASEDIYGRAFGAIGFTSNLGRVRGQTIKLSFSLRYFSEISPEAAVRAAGLDTYRYTAVALQIPAATFPGFDNTRNSFVLSYATGELPFNRSSDKTLELGFRHDVDFSEFF